MKKILIIEDTDFISENIATTLRFEGYSTRIAEDGVDGLEEVRDFDPDLILCDVSMPRLDGFGVLSELRKMSDKHSTTPFIFLTAKAEKTDMRRGMELGADDYLTKPFTTVELINAVTSQFSKKQLLDEKYEEKLDELRGNITYALPHEFRTALSGILGYSEEIVRATADTSTTTMDKADINDLAHAIKEAGRRLEKLTENFLVYTQIQILQTQPERLAEIRANKVYGAHDFLVERAQAAAEQYERRADLKVDVDDTGVRMTSENYAKILSELLDNAFRFSEKGDRVEIRLRNHGSTCEIEIRDEGRGMSEDQIAKIGAYNQFERQVYEQQGVGLGLTVARLLAELHEGSLTIESKLGAGTSVRLNLLAFDSFAEISGD